MSQPYQYRHRCSSEDFTNTNEHGDNFTIFPTDKYQRIPLTAPDSPDNTPLNLLLGQASRRIKKNRTVIDISANLYVLDGNVYDQDPSLVHKYRAYIKTDQNDVIDIGTLLKGGDGMYTLSYSTENNIAKFTTLSIQYEQKDRSPIVMLRGQFANV
jgi:hypothetical protein